MNRSKPSNSQKAQSSAMRKKAKTSDAVVPDRPESKLGKAITIKFDQPKEVRAIARERVGMVKPAQTMVPKNARKKPKHKKPPENDIDSA